MSNRLEVTKEIPLRTFVVRAAMTTGVLAFWGGMLMAARRYPSEYDWRYMTLSSLISPARNPAGHLWASAGILLCGICGLWWSAVLTRRSDPRRVREARTGIQALRIGNLFMVSAAIVPRWLFPVPKGHEILALLAFLGLCLGVLELTFQTVARALRLRNRSSPRRARLYAGAVAGISVLPILLAGLAQAYVYYVLPELHWVSLAWRDRGVHVYLSFAFWEWATTVLLSAYLVILSAATPGHFAREEGAAR
jgi:hypothetical protein